MPELPEVEVVKQSLKKYIINKTLIKIIVKNNKLRILVPTNISEKLSDLKILGVKRVSKYVVIEFKNNIFLIIHLGMSGTLHLVKKNENNLENTNLSFYHTKRFPKKHNHIFFYFDDFIIVFNDPRRFGFLKLIEGQLNLNNYFSKLGPEPLEKKFNFKYTKNYLFKKTKNIKNTLIDQKFISGLGNIYSSEILNYSKINPLKFAGKITDKEIEKIIFFTKKVLKRSIKRGGTTINNFQSIKGNQGSYQKEFRAYNRESKRCKNKSCLGTIVKLNISNRSTYMCNFCQK
tara:strand:+ start:13878 stop:14744 length:867 start_codon:yes stop_codon:yes gene_type:complete